MLTLIRAKENVMSNHEEEMLVNNDPNIHVNSMLDALVRVCYKRYNRYLESGATKQLAAEKVVAYLDNWISNHGKDEGSRKHTFGTELKKNYEYMKSY